MVLKHDLATKGNMATEVVPLLQAETKRLLESLYFMSVHGDRAKISRIHPVKACHALQILLCRLKRSSRFVDFNRHLLYRCALSINYE
jgi:hypothetical protein